MSARKPIARMEDPTDCVNDLVSTTTEESKREPIENGDTATTSAPAVSTIQTESKDTLQIKEEKLETEDDSSTEPTTTVSNTDAKRTTRNSPLLVSSPAKKKVSDSQEQDSSTESINATDEASKKTTDKQSIIRTRKHSDPNNKSSTSTTPPTNRLTRKSAAQNRVANTRLTRARRASGGAIGTRSETPPKRKYVFKKSLEITTTVGRRKRSCSPKPSADEPDSKISKSEEQDSDSDINAVTVKQEVIESSEEMVSDVASDITEPFSAEPTRISLRARKSATTYSPSTRTYRQNKDKDRSNTDVSTTSDSKKKKLSRVRADEDSKDSMTSSNMDESVDIKIEVKFPSEDTNEAVLEPLASASGSGSEEMLSVTQPEVESVEKPLSVDTNEVKSDTQQPATATVSMKSNSSDKAASLSPDLISEGVSEISVKRFYKKPEFLENNLGIEKDPKLGEIVQNVTEKLDDPIERTSVSNESIKEGDLVFEEEDEEDVGSIGSIKNDDDDDGNSVSTGFISPLIVEEEEDEEEEEPCATDNGDKTLVMTLDQVESLKPEATKPNPNVADDQDKEKAEVPSENVTIDEPVECKHKTEEPCDNTIIGDIEVKEEKDIPAPTDDQTNEDKSVIETKPLDQKKEIMEEMAVPVEEIKPNPANPDTVSSVTDENKSEQLQIKSPEEDESLSESSKTASPTKMAVDESSGESSTPSTSPQSTKSASVPHTPENDECLRQKERHFKTLGLLTLKAADEAKLAKQKRRKFLHNLSNNGTPSKNTNANTNAAANSGSAAGGGGSGAAPPAGNGGSATEPKRGKNLDSSSKATTSTGYSSRRHSLKMTFQKGRGRPSNAEKSGEHLANTSGDDSYYTIQNETQGGTPSKSSTVAETSATPPAPPTTSHGRKSYNRSSTIDASHHSDHHEAVNSSKKDEKEEILIPEKASSFKFHPGRLCQDQCYYCSGKFGLYDTPCHVGQIKSVERQQKILANEEKLTVDNCLCDACFRHVDRRANVQTYKKRLSAPGNIETATTSTKSENKSSVQDKTQNIKAQQQSNGTATPQICAVPECGNRAAHSLRRKAIRKSIKKSLLNFDMSTAGTYLHICEKHYEAVVQSSGCVLCKRRLGKNSMYHITTDTSRLEKALAAMGIPVTLGQGTAVCKLCRYFANLLLKPPENGKVQKVEFVKNYKKRLLQFYNIHDKKDSSHENDDDEEEDDEDKEPEKSETKKQTKKRARRKSITPDEVEEEHPEISNAPPSPSNSTGSSVEVISDEGTVDESPEPRTATTSSTTTTTTTTGSSTSNQMVLDNDVMVDYDVPMISSSSASSVSSSPTPQDQSTKDHQSKLKAILQSVGTSIEDRGDISNVLRSNPNISMRELFPGEEDLGLQFKAPFGSSGSQRTPEGWTRVNTFLQYDEPTRRLWEDLQKPYGNQSSFLRHLILLEKYYRNGDLVLSSAASSNATVYTQTVRNRLASFDSRSSESSSSFKDVEMRSRSLSVEKIQRQLSSNSVTITARPKDQKQQQSPKESEIAKQKETTQGTATAPNSRSILKTNLIGVKSSAIEILPLSASNSTSNSPHSPSGSTTSNDNPQLTKQQKILAAAKKLVNNKLEASSNQKKTSLNTTPPELISLNRRPAQSPNPQQSKRPQLLPKPMNSGKPLGPNVIVLPDTLTPQERLESKSWRPTLLPVSTSSHHLNNQQGPLYQTADGRRLPALVQVQSGGKPFLISIHDYNRMCILRREKLMRDQMLKGSKGRRSSIIPPAACIPSSSKQFAANAALSSFNKTVQAVTVAENAAKKHRLMTSKAPIFTPIAPKPISQTSSVPSSSISSQQQSSAPSQATVILPSGTLHPINLIQPQTPSSLSVLSNYTGQILPLLNPNTSTSVAATTTVGSVPTNSWLWNNFPDSNQMLVNGKATASKGPQQQTAISAKQQSLLLDNNLMSKIPKSLTVIPQHKLMPAGSAASLNMSKD